RPVAGLHVPASWHWSEAVHSMPVPTQAPASQLSPCVQAFPSLQALPVILRGGEQTPVAGLHVPASWHWSEAVHAMPVPTQAPAWQLSPCVQAFPSLQALPFILAGFEQTPVAGLHVPASWHWSEAVHSMPVPTQAPPWQLSPCVQAFPSLQALPFILGAFEQTPVVWLHAPAASHRALHVHPTRRSSEPPASQLSPCVQAFPSLQALPLILAGFEQTPVAGLHVPAS